MAMARALGSGVETVAYHVGVFVKCDVLALARTRPVRGAIEHYNESPLTGPSCRRWPEVFVSQDCSEGDVEATLIDLVAAAS
jgi:hypothetical protein